MKLLVAALKHLLNPESLEPRVQVVLGIGEEGPKQVRKRENNSHSLVSVKKSLLPLPGSYGGVS
jgi:hypothetical protein